MLMFLAPTLANVYQATLATGKANVKVRFQNLVNTKVYSNVNVCNTNEASTLFSSFTCSYHS